MRTIPTKLRIECREKREENGFLCGSFVMIQEFVRSEWIDRFAFTNEEEALAFVNSRRWERHLK